MGDSGYSIGYRVQVQGGARVRVDSVGKMASRRNAQNDCLGYQPRVACVVENAIKKRKICTLPNLEMIQALRTKGQNMT